MKAKQVKMSLSHVYVCCLLYATSLFAPRVCALTFQAHDALMTIVGPLPAPTFTAFKKSCVY